MRRPPTEALLRHALMLWAGMAIGVGFIATPAKFLAPSLSLPVALDVGRHTFAVYNGLELLLTAALLGVAALIPNRRFWLIALAGPAAIVVAEAFWLLPSLDSRVTIILAGQVPPPSSLHVAYIAAEGLKIMILIAIASGLYARHPWQPRTDRPSAQA